MLDGCDPEVLEAAMNDGRLPHLAALRADGCAGAVGGLPGLGANALMPSLYTGVKPDRHGRYYHRQSQAGAYAATEDHATDVAVPAFYDLLAREGRRVLLVNPPKAPAPVPADSLRAVLGWNMHLSAPAREFATCPPALEDELLQRLGAATPCPCLTHRHEPSASLAVPGVLASLRERISRQRQAAAWQLAEADWEIAVVGLDAGHCAGHLLWHCHDPGHPDHPGPGAPDPLQAVCEELDRAIGELSAALTARDRVAVFAGPGMGPGYVHPDFLERLLRAREAGAGRSRSSARQLLKRGWRRLPAAWRRALSAPGKRLDARLQRDSYQRRDCFPVVLNDNVGGIRINREGRERHGRVPAAACEPLARDLCRLLESLRCVDSGEPVVRRALVTADHYGPAAGATLPDVLVEWNEAGPVTAVSGEGIRNFRQDTPPQWTGAHNDRMWLLLAGPGIGPGRLPARAGILDVAGTLSALAGGPPAIGDGYALLSPARTGQPARQDSSSGS